MSAGASRPHRAEPTVSLVVPTHGRPARLAACVRALGRLRYPKGRFEIVVVDDGSPRPVEPGQLVAETSSIRVLRQAQTGPSRARNAGVAAADGEIIAFVDDDCEPEPEWLERLVRYLGEGERTIAGGRTVNALTENPFAEASQALITYLYDYYSTRRREHMFFTTNNLAIRRSDFLALGGFNPRFRRAAGEDREFCVRCGRAGFRLVYDADAVVRHAHDLTLRTFWRQQLAYGREALTFRSLDTSGDQSRREPLSFYARLLHHPHATSMRAPVRTSALLLLSQIANATGFALEARARRGVSRTATT